jgi:hypothetical protein
MGVCVRKDIVCVIVLLCPLILQAQNPSASQSPNVSPGTINGALYENESLGVRLAVPNGWTAALPSGDSSSIDPQHVGSAFNLCSQRLVTLETKEPKGKGYLSSSILLAVNPGCFPSATLPTTSDPIAVRAFANELVTMFHGTDYIPPSGVDIGAEHKSKHQFVYLQGSGYRDMEPGPDGKKVHVNSLIAFTESNGYWIAWVSLVDDKAKQQLVHSNIQFKED